MGRSTLYSVHTVSFNILAWNGRIIIKATFHTIKDYESPS